MLLLYHIILFVTTPRFYTSGSCLFFHFKALRRKAHGSANVLQRPEQKSKFLSVVFRLHSYSRVIFAHGLCEWGTSARNSYRSLWLYDCVWKTGFVLFQRRTAIVYERKCRWAVEWWNVQFQALKQLLYILYQYFLLFFGSSRCSKDTLKGHISTPYNER